MVKAALVSLLVALLAISSGNLAAAQSTSVLATVAPAGTKVKTTTTTSATTAVVPKTTKATTTATKATATTTTKTTTTATGTKTTAATTTKVKATTAPATKTLAKSKSTAGTTTTDATTKKSLTKSASTNTRVSPLVQPSNGLPNWVGPRVNAPTGEACYRKTQRASTICSTGYALDSLKAACWAECPLEYPIQCGMECIPQNKDCAKAVTAKILPAANAALSAASLGVFGAITKSVKTVNVAVRCSKQLYSIVTKAVKYINEIEKKQPAATTQKLVLALKQSDIVAIDLPLGIASCLGLPIASAFSTAKEIVGPIKSITEVIVNQIVALKNKILEPKQFLNVTATAGVNAVAKMPAADASKLDAIVTCGGELKDIVDKVVDKIQELKEKSPTAPLDAIRLALSSTELVLVDIPRATKDCVPKSTKAFYEVRDQVRQAFQVIMDKVVDSSSQPTSAAEDAPLEPLSKKDYALKVGGFGLDVIAMFDPTGFADLARAYIQKICGPTNFFGEIDDGELKNALGLNMIGKAFQLSSGLYKKKGDGVVKINFISKDTEDVEVNIFSAGKLIGTVKLQKDKVVMWTKPMKDLQDKTLYLDRWRPGFLRIPGTGGGSLVMWIPHSSEGGHIDLAVVLNVSR